jgi:hypothetical protein
MLGVCAVAAGAFAQGTVQFFPTASTLSSAKDAQGNVAATSGAAGSFYYGLLTAATANGPFTFSGTYATNLTAAGYFGSPAARTVTGWAAGATMSYEVAMWSSSLGATWNPNWLIGNFGNVTTGVFGLSAVATGVSGGLGTPATLPLPLFSSTGISTGILGTQIGGTVVPEPSSMALAGLGAAALLIFRRRK